MYGTVEGRDAFFVQRLNSWEWQNATDSDKAKALNQAAELIDQFEYVEFETVPETFATAAYLIAKALPSGQSGPQPRASSDFLRVLWGRDNVQ